MQYFTREMHHPATPRSDFDKAAGLYREQLAELLPGLPEAERQFFEDVTLHDGTLLSMRVGDDIDRRFGSLTTRPANNRQLAAELQVLNDEETALTADPWYMRYADRAGNPIDDWMCDELTSAGDHPFRHEVPADLTRVDIVNCLKSKGNKRQQLFEGVTYCNENNNSDMSPGQILLVLQIPVSGQ